jgi:glyoxylase-like metal-dependent hydrolase (beta-lactamase superfamily II)
MVVLLTLFEISIAQSSESKSQSVTKAELSRTPEDPKLVWTPSHVVLLAKEIGPNAYAVYPDDAEAKNEAGIPVATSGGFVVGNNGVLVIESMLNRRLADQMLALIRENTDKPILYVVNTSYHGDHSFGNQFFPKGVQFVQHVNTQTHIQDRFAEDVTFMKKYFGGNQGLDELGPQSAQILVHDGSTIDIDLGGKRVQIMHLGFAQTEGDLFVYLPNEQIVYTGNPIIADGPSFPWLLDGKLEESLVTMKKLLTIVSKDAIIVPGHGKPTGVNAIEYSIRYLSELKTRIQEAVTQGLTEEQTVERLSVSMKEYNAYKIFPWVHSQVNVPRTYQELKQSR